MQHEIVDNVGSKRARGEVSERDDDGVGGESDGGVSGVCREGDVCCTASAMAIDGGDGIGGTRDNGDGSLSGDDKGDGGSNGGGLSGSGAMGGIDKRQRGRKGGKKKSGDQRKTTARAAAG